MKRSFFSFVSCMFLVTVFLGPVKADPRVPKSSQGNGSTPQNMALIPTGSFLMGDTVHGDEGPIHEVFLDAFYIDLHEVTNEDYERYDPRHQRSPFSLCNHCPVTFVSWEEAVEYCRAQNKRLPTEAEWEKAGQGPGGNRYDYGNDYDPTKAHAGKALDEGTISVASYAPNGYGVYDMSGNVWEWVADWYDGKYYHRSPQENPKGPDQGSFRSFRGGSWNVDVCYSRIKNRDGGVPTERYHFVGFRCARSAP